MLDIDKNDELKQLNQKCKKIGLECMILCCCQLVLYFFFYEKQFWLFGLLPHKLFLAFQIFFTIGFIIGGVTYLCGWVEERKNDKKYQK